ncbi:MAG: hypothetical protein JO250_03830 [Armatimonadetes bacterium]|nr:hypothetical protein [Armatimonadota bacterium]
MLQGLDQIDWRRLGHAYGPADDVPETLRAVASGEMTAQDAAERLTVSICHQTYNIYNVSADTIPFVRELVGYEDVSGREWLLLLLADFAGALFDFYSADLLRKWIEPGNGDFGVYEVAAAKYEWVSRARHVLEEGLPEYLALLNHDRPEIRVAAARLLASLPNKAVQAITHIKERLASEVNDNATASLLMALSVVGSEDPDLVSGLWMALRSGRPVSSVISAMILARLETDQEVVAKLREAIRESEAANKSFTFTAWGLDRADELACDALYHLEKDKANDLLLTLLSQAPGTVSDYAITRALLKHNFKPLTRDEKKAHHRVPRGSLSRPQERILREFCRLYKIWGNVIPHWRSDPLRALRGLYGIPNRCEELADFLEESEVT